MFVNEGREVRHELSFENNDICDLNDNMCTSHNDEPLDLSMKQKDYGRVIKQFKTHDYGWQMNYQYNHQVKATSSELRNPVVTEKDISALIDSSAKSLVLTQENED